MVSLAGCSVSDREPTWKICVLSRISTSISSFSILVSAPGFLAKENVLSPFSSIFTNARVVKYFSSRSIPSVSTFSFSSTDFKNSPCISFPAFPIKAVCPPSFATATATFAGAPPGFWANSVCPSSFTPCQVKSIRISPNVVMS